MTLNIEYVRKIVGRMKSGKHSDVCVLNIITE